MKRIWLYFSICLALFNLQAVRAEEDVDTARAATRRSDAQTTITSSNRQQSSIMKDSSSYTQGSSRISNIQAGTTGTQTVRDRSASTDVVARQATSSKNIVTRNATTSNVQTRQSSLQLTAPTSISRQSIATQKPISITRYSSSTTQPSSTTSRSALTINRSLSTPKITATTSSSLPSTRRSVSTNTISRAATNFFENPNPVTAEEIMSRDYTKCREVYYACMDEFCANKDAQLKRCACSTRANEFDTIKKQLENVEDKLLDFNQRLLTVNMDKEDADALFEATEGEIAFNQEDTSDSKKILDEISQKLNDTFGDIEGGNSLSAIHLTLDTQSAFDSVDYMLGSEITAKSGPELYRSALPVCREMALEVCDAEEIDIVESSYQMLIEQDCTTVAKSYETQQDQAKAKVLEGSALLDMSRLDIYQKRNSDDILTCKRKMLDMLTNNSVCGEDLGKCLDTTGQYIDPSTGEAFLTENLVNLGYLLTRPSVNQTWTTTPGNEKFVSFLNSKKKYLEPAMENCQDISDMVWDGFLEDALAQIKLAQEKKLEDMRQACTTLTTECISESAESLEDFDSRALSIFGVQADKTVKEMCSGVMNACTALMRESGGSEDWVGGMTEIATDQTFETINQTCREVGRSCIIQACKSISGNFGLCENIQNSINRKSIINRTSCWQEVTQCVRDAGETAINDITSKLIKDGVIDEATGTFYKSLYGYNPAITITNSETSADSCSDKDKTSVNCVYDICANECGYNCTAEGCEYLNKKSFDCRVCRIAENLWGNCEVIPTQNLKQETSHNEIKVPIDKNTDTLLHWFAVNTGTDSKRDSCRDTSCGAGFVPIIDENGNLSCVPKTSTTDDGEICPENFLRITVMPGLTNCCKSSEGSGRLDVFGNCCNNKIINGISGLEWGTNTSYYGQRSGVSTAELCLPDGTSDATFTLAMNLSSTAENYYDVGMHFLICLGDLSSENPTTNYPSGQTVRCNGRYVLINKTTGKYISPKYESGSGASTPSNYYISSEGSPVCTWDQATSTWTPNQAGLQCPTDSPNKWQIKY